MKSTYITLAGSLFMTACLQCVSAAPKDLMGYADGAEVIQIETPREYVIDTLNNVTYSQIISTREVRQLRMSLLVPRNNELKPAIVYFPGGGFTSSDYGKFIEMRMALAKAGFVVAAAEYRVVPNVFPAPVIDGKAAVRYLREHASEYGIDPERIGVLGDSAGGWLVQMLGVTNGDKQFDKGDFLDKSSDVQSVATIYGISNLLNIGEGFPEDIQKVHRSPSVTEALLVHGPAFRNWPGATIGSDPQKALAASPIHYVKGSKPPFFIMHGSADTLVSPIQSAQLYTALKAQGNKVNYVLIQGAGHGDIPWFQDSVINRVVDWFRQTLGEPKKAQDAVKTDGNANL